MSKLITVLFISTFSFTALANVPLNSPNVIDKIENITESKIDKHQDYMNKQLTKSVDKRSNKIIMDTMNDFRAHNLK